MERRTPNCKVPNYGVIIKRGIRHETDDPTRLRKFGVVPCSGFQ